VEMLDKRMISLSSSSLLSIRWGRPDSKEEQGINWYPQYSSSFPSEER
jgi:hypothetical protein